MPTKPELEVELAELKAKLAAAPARNYMQSVNPNLIIALHYAGKALWLVLACILGIIGYQLYALGVKAVGNADAILPLGISFSLHDAGPGLIVMVIALLCSLVGAVKAKIELTPDAIRVMGGPVPHLKPVRTPEDVELPVSVTNGALVLLIEALDEGVASWAASKLAEIGSAAAPAVPALMKLLDWRRNCPDWWFSDREWKLIRDKQRESVPIRHAAMKALGAIGSAAADAIPILVKTLNHPDDDVEVLGHAAQTLGVIGVSSETVHEVLSKAAQHAHSYVSTSAVQALRTLS